MGNLIYSEKSRFEIKKLHMISLLGFLPQMFLPDAYPDPELELEPDLLPNPWVFKTNSTVPSTTPGRRFFRVVLSDRRYF